MAEIVCEIKPWICYGTTNKGPERKVTVQRLEGTINKIFCWSIGNGMDEENHICRESGQKCKYYTSK